MPTQGAVTGGNLDVTIMGGKGLVAKDKHLFGKNSSDPYCVLTLESSGKTKQLFKTKTIMKNLAPKWNESKKHILVNATDIAQKELVFTLFDYDAMSADDFMGEVRVPLKSLGSFGSAKEYPVVPGKSGKRASGTLELRIDLTLRHSLTMDKADSMPLQGVVACGLGWDLLVGGKAIDLDASCVATAHNGQILMDESVYFADHSNSNGSIRHSGDEREGDENLGDGDDEVILMDLDRINPQVSALFIIITVASQGHTFRDVKTSRMRLVGTSPPLGQLCEYFPGTMGDNTALFVCRIARVKGGAGWLMNVIGDTDLYARDFGSVIPEIKTYMADLVPGIKVDPLERIALLNKGCTVRVRDYCGPAGIPKTLTFGLAWDVTNGQNIDLDASAVVLDGQLNVLDKVWFRHLRSEDGSIQHCGDEREGDAAGDDEKIMISLQAVHPMAAYVGFVINSFSGQELDDVSKASCHLFDQASGRDIMMYKLKGAKILDKKTALVMALLYRDGGSGEWCIRIIGEPAMGRTVDDNVDELQNYIKRNPILPLGPSRPIAAAAGAMMRTTEGGLTAFDITVPPNMTEGMQVVVHGPTGPAWVTIPAGVGAGQIFTANI